MVLTPSSRSRLSRPRNLLITIVAASSLAVLAACGGASTAGPAAPAGSSSPVTAPTGSPIKTMTISAVDWNGPTYEDIQIVGKLYAQWINDRGGINGHPLDVLTCDDKGDPAQTQACARKGLDAGVVADVGTFTYNAGVMDPVYNGGTTAVFGGCCNLAPNEFTLSNTFQMGPNPALNAGGIAQAVKDGCKNIAVLELDLGAITTGPNGLQTIFDNTAKAFGYTGKLKHILVPLTTQDYTAQVAQATEGTDCISMFLSGSNIAGLLPAFAQTGGTQHLYGAQGNFDHVSTKGFESLPGVANGTVYGGYPPLSDPAWKDLRDAIKQYAAPSKFDYNSLAALGVWAAYSAFNQIVTGMSGDINHTTFLAAAASAKVDTKGMTPPLDFAKTWPAFGGAYLRTFNTSVTMFKWSDGSTIGDRFLDLNNAMQGNAP